VCNPIEPTTTTTAGGGGDDDGGVLSLLQFKLILNVDLLEN
jgi:hypothetical protein